MGDLPVRQGAPYGLKRAAAAACLFRAQQFAEVIKSEITKWAKVVKASGARPE